MACLLSGGVKARIRVAGVRVGVRVDVRLGIRLRRRLRASSERRRERARCACVPPWRRQQRCASLHLEVVGDVARLTNDVLSPPMGEDEQRSSGRRAGGEDGQVTRDHLGGKVWAPSRRGGRRKPRTFSTPVSERSVTLELARRASRAPMWMIMCGPNARRQACL